MLNALKQQITNFQKRYSWRMIFLFVIIPLIIAFWLFPSTYEVPRKFEGDSRFTLTANSNMDVSGDGYVWATQAELQSGTYLVLTSPPPSLEEVIRQIFNTPFEFDWYYLCFENYASPVVNYQIVNLSISGEKKILNVSYKEKVCTPIRKDDKTTYNITAFASKKDLIWQASSGRPTGVAMSLVATIAKPEWWSLLVKFFLFTIAWDTLWLLLFEIHNRIKLPQTST